MTALARIDAAPASARPTLALELIVDMAQLPDSFIVHAATSDDNAPLICRGDIVVVNVGGRGVTGGWMPVEGELFLIEYEGVRSGGERYIRRYRCIVQAFTDDTGRWWVGPLRRGMHGQQLVCSDGPYPDECALADKLIGKVVGLYRPVGGVQ